jgi:DNA-directed RNA polymerase subunit M/transcription elongation factor TFIIS
MYYYPSQQKIVNPTEFRENVRRKLAKELNIPVQSAAAINLEKGIFNFAIKEGASRKIVKKWENPAFVFIYADRWKTIMLNLDGSMQEDPECLAEMTHQELKPDHWTELISQKQKRDSFRFAKRVGSSTDMFTCKKCHKKDCTYYEMQTRSADEPATIFITCQNCGKHWKI